MKARALMLIILEIAKTVTVVGVCVNTKPNCYYLPDAWCVLGTNVEAQCALRCWLFTVSVSAPTQTSLTSTPINSSTLPKSSKESATTIPATESSNHTTASIQTTTDALTDVTTNEQSSMHDVTTRGEASTQFEKQAALMENMTTATAPMTRSATISTYEKTTDKHDDGATIADLAIETTATADNIDVADTHNSTAADNSSVTMVKVMTGSIVSMIICVAI